MTLVVVAQVEQIAKPGHTDYNAWRETQKAQVTNGMNGSSSKQSLAFAKIRISRMVVLNFIVYTFFRKTSSFDLRTFIQVYVS